MMLSENQLQKLGFIFGLIPEQRKRTARFRTENKTSAVLEDNRAKGLEDTGLLRSQRKFPKNVVRIFHKQ